MSNETKLSFHHGQHETKLVFCYYMYYAQKMYIKCSSRYQMETICFGWMKVDFTLPELFFSEIYSFI
jgi:hypothetical protein